MKSKPKFNNCVYRIKVDQELIKIPYNMCLKIMGKCPKCGHQEVACQVLKIHYYRIKYKQHRRLELNKIKKQINKQLKAGTLVCNNCGSKEAGFYKFLENLNSFKSTV